MYWPLQQQGSAGENVRTVQYLLNANGAGLTVDGAFGPNTLIAVVDFQTSVGLAGDGVVGDATWGALIVTVAAGASGDAVSAVQSQLNARSGQVTVDGSFGPATLRAVQMFQDPIGLVVDGIVNWYTWHALVHDYLRSSNAATCMQDVFQAWADNEQKKASFNATPAVLSSLFGHPWKSTDNWNFVGCGVALGSVFCTWNSGSNKLIIGGPDPGGGLYIYARSAEFS